MSAASYRVDQGNRTVLDASLAELQAQRGDWRQQLRDAVRDPAELERLLELPAGSLVTDDATAGKFPLRVPHAFVDRIKRGDPLDPLLRQILPVAAEQIPAAGFSADPLAELGVATAGSLCKYPGRALLITTGACPIHCRYCFRREFPYSDQTASRADWQPALDAIRRQAGIHELILSGGDPLSLGNRQLAALIDAIEAIGRIRTLRIHTRFPIALPARVDTGLTDILARTRLKTVVVVHTNHPAEIDAQVRRAAAELKRCTNVLLNQAVLLRGINDNVETLAALGEQLIGAGIVPYYLHRLDRVAGSAHFEVDDDTAVRLIDGLRRQTPGYLVPRLVREDPGALSKTPLG